MARPETSPGADARVIGLISLAHGFSHFYQLVLPPLFLLLQAEFGVGFTELGLAMTLFYVSSGLAQTPAGFLVDRFGARNVLILGLAVYATGTALYGLIPSFWWLLPLVVVTGLGNSVFHPADFSIMTASVSERRLGRAYSFHTFGGTLGWAAAPVAMFGIAQVAGWRVALIAAGLLGLVVVVLLLSQRRHLAEDFAAAGRREGTAPAGGIAILLSRPVLICFAYFFVFSVALIGIQSFLPASLAALYGTSPADANMALTGYLMGSAAGVLLGGILADRSSRHDLLVACGLSIGAALVLTAGSIGPGVSVIVVLMTLCGFAMASTQPSRDLLVRASATRGGTGRVFGFVYSALDAGAAVGPLVIGLLLDHGASRQVFWFIALMLAVSVAMVAVLRRAAGAPVAAPAE